MANLVDVTLALESKGPIREKPYACEGTNVLAAVVNVGAGNARREQKVLLPSYRPDLNYQQLFGCAWRRPVSRLLTEIYIRLER
jgi:hypothetical protein